MSRAEATASKGTSGVRLWPLSLCLVLMLVLAQSAVMPLLDGNLWWFATSATGAAVLLSASAVRSIGAPIWVGSVTGTVVWAAIVVGFFAPTTTFLGILPTGETLNRFSELVAAASRSIYMQSMPADANHEIMFLLTLGVGAIALVLDVVALSWRLPALTGVVILLVVVPPSIFTGEVELLPYALTGASFLLMLWIDTRLRRSGTRQPGGILVIGGVALVSAVALTAAVPGYYGGSLVSTSGGIAFGHGISPLVDLGKDLQRPGNTITFTYTTNSSSHLYFRLMTLDVFDGTTWSASDEKVRIPIESTTMTVPGLDDEIATETAQTRVSISGLVARSIPMPFPSIQVTGLDGRWDWEPSGLTVSSRSGTSRNQSYDVTSLVLKPTATQLRSAPQVIPLDVRPFLEVEGEVPTIITKTLADLTAEAASPYDVAFAIQDFLRTGNFAYSVEAPVQQGYDGDGLGVIATFLERRSGYCVHFASAMAIMARLAGVPARVSLGYLPGDRIDSDVENGSRYQVGSDDLHAWPELYFTGVGWVPFEPTPGRGVVPDYAFVFEEAPAETETPVDLSPERSQAPTVAPTDTANDNGTSAKAAAEQFPLTTGILVIGLALVLSVPGLVRAQRRARRRSRLRASLAGAELAWRELIDTANDFGYRASSRETVRSFAERFATTAELDPERRDALTRLLTAIERDRYSRDPERFTNGPPLDSDLGMIISVLAMRATPIERFRAIVVPASVLAPTVSPRTAE